MKLRNIIREAITNAVKQYDFEEQIKIALDEINLELIIENKIESRLEDIDFESIINDVVDDIFDEEFDAYDLQELIAEELEN